MQDADVVDRLLGQDGALAQRPAQVLLADPAALAAVDEELGRLAVAADRGLVGLASLAESSETGASSG